MARMSVATIDKPEFINVTPYNPLISKCEIKVFYLGENRNRSYISKEVATEMANSLPGCPIVGYYREQKQDFGDHGEQVTIDADGVHFKYLTTPYGFVDPNAKVWFQKFQDTDEFGNETIREYLMTTGFLWTGQYEEAQRVIDKGNPHSMELDEKTLDGHWANNNKTKVKFFIINDALFSKLCILGEDIEPCFEGSSVTAPQVSASFSKDKNNFNKFKTNLYTMMQELKIALEGGQQMLDKFDKNEDSTKEEDKKDKTDFVENQNSTEEQSIQPNTDFAKEEEESKAKEDKKEDEEDKFAKKEDEEEKSVEENKKEDEDEENKKKFSLLESEYETLKQNYSELEVKYQALVDFKNEVDNQKKDELINSFYMLSDEDKKDVIENKTQYSYDEIESKLSVICVRKKVNFDLDEEDSTKKEEPIVTYSLNDDTSSSVPAWISAIRNTKNNRTL